MNKQPTFVPRRQIITEYTVTSDDIDVMGILYYGRYSIFFDIVRKLLFREYGYPDMYAWGEEGWTMPTIRYSTRIFRMAREGDKLRLVSWVQAQKGVRLVLALEVWSEDGSQQVAQGFCEGCFLDDKTFRPIKPADNWKLIRGLREEEAEYAEHGDAEEIDVTYRPPIKQTDPDNHDPEKY